MTPTSCPRCGREIVDGGCLFCGPLSELTRAPPKREAAPEAGQRGVHAGWKGYDRDLGARKRAERAAEVVAGKESEERRSRLPALVGTVVGFAILGGSAFLWTSGALDRQVDSGSALTGDVKLPTVLQAPASPSRGELGLLARALDELAADIESQLVGDLEPNPSTVERFAARLDGLKDTARGLEPKLTREEGRVLVGLQAAIRDTATFLASFRTEAPDAGGGRIRHARDTVGRALVVLRGGDPGDVVRTYAEKANAATKAARDIE